MFGYLNASIFTLQHHFMISCVNILITNRVVTSGVDT